MATIEVSGVKDFIEKLGADEEKADLAARNIVTKGVLIIERNAKKHFRARPTGSQRTSKRTGRRYYEGAPKYPASPPDPTNRTGNLMASIHSSTAKRTGSAWMASTGPSVYYAPFVNYGTSRARAFPFMTNGLKDSEHDIKDLAEAEWAKAQE
jgi:HK97 gp10 family phage protein